MIIKDMEERKRERHSRSPYNSPHGTHDSPYLPGTRRKDGVEVTDASDETPTARKHCETAKGGAETGLGSPVAPNIRQIENELVSRRLDSPD